MLAFLGLLGAVMAGVAADVVLRQPESDDHDNEDAEAGPDDGDGSDPQARGELLDAGIAIADTEPADTHWTGLDEADDRHAAGAGDDTLWGLGGNDQLDAGAGDDFVEAGAGRDIVLGGDGQDTLVGGDGDDALDGNEGNDAQYGGKGDDRIAGHAGDDFLSGGTGNDSLIGGEGQDTLVAGDGQDWLSGGWGDDRLNGGPGGDTLDGNAGNDTLIGGTRGAQSGLEQSGQDMLNGGSGDDLIFLQDGDLAFGGDGADQFMLADWDGTGILDMIGDYDADEDELVVLYDGKIHADPHVSLMTDGDTDDVTIALDGVPLAVVVNAPGLNLADIRLQRAA